MPIFKVIAKEDTIYIKADDQSSAKKKLFSVTGRIPDSLMDWSEVKELPNGEEFFAE